MVIKSLTITEAAYDTLKHLKHDDESFSQVILRIGKGRSRAVEKYFGVLKGTSPGADELIKSIKDRRRQADVDAEKKRAKLRGINGNH